MEFSEELSCFLLNIIHYTDASHAAGAQLRTKCSSQLFEDLCRIQMQSTPVAGVAVTESGSSQEQPTSYLPYF